MTGIWTIVGDWGYAVAAALYTVLAILLSRRARTLPAASRPPQVSLVIALVMTALWALHCALSRAMTGLPSLSGGLVETARNGAWVAVLWVVIGGAARRTRSLRPVLGALILALISQSALDMLIADVRPLPDFSLSLVQTAWLLRAATALGSIVLLHGLFARIDRDERGGIGWLGCALTAMWAYEFNHYVLAWLSDGKFHAVSQLRGLAVAAIAPMILLGLSGRKRRRLALSRPVAYRTAAISFAAIYALTLLAMMTMIRASSDPAVQVVQLGAVFALSVIAFLLLPSASFRAWLRVEIAKHLFTHRYDYREEWMRFADTLGSAGADDALPPRRAARAVADAVSSPAALLLLPDEVGVLRPEAAWNWPEMDDAAHVIDVEMADHLRSTGWIAAMADAGDASVHLLPAWLRGAARVWALVPLIHGGQLAGAVLLARPPGRRTLDWEDFDMLRVVARQLAVTLSEQRHQRALAEAQRFDEFNRRFAFILHDIKNIVSQMSLLAANAERHAENPAFRADMVLTLRETADRMNDMIARLARSDQRRPGEQGQCDLAEVARIAAARGEARERAEVSGESHLPIRGDATLLAEAIGHILQNAIDATPADGPPVRLLLSREAGMARLAIVDRGRGMDATFLRDGLFQPFTSTKTGGFGLGAHEARSLVTAMGGALTVASRPGAGSEFTLSLPLIADEQPVPHSLPDRPTLPDRHILPDRKTG